MPDGTKPAFNPNKPFESIVTDKPKFNPKEQYTVEVPDTSAYANVLNAQEDANTFENIISNIPDLDDSKKETIRDLAKRGVKGEELSNSILTLQGKHPRQDQDGSVKYYINDKGLPTPLKNNERPPVGYEVASIWGSQKDANDDAWYTDLAKTVYNVLPSTAENVIDLAQTGYELVTDKESENLNSLKNAANYLKFAKDEDLNKSMFNTQGIDEWSDLLDTKRLDFSPEAIWGTVNGLLGSIGEFAVAGSGATKVAKWIGGVAELSKGSQIASNVVASTLTNLGEVRDAATEIGLTGRDRALFTSAVAPIISAVDVKWGLAPKIFGNTVAQEEKQAFLKALGKAIPRDAEGNITKEGVQELAKVTTAGYTHVAKKLGQLTATDVLQEGGQEALQQFIQNSGEQLWDKLTDKEKKKFGTDAFSPESFGEYISNGIAGLVGGGGVVIGHTIIKNRDKQVTQNNNAFELAKSGNDAIKNFASNVDLAVKNGTMTKEEAGNALLKVQTYKQYYDQTKDTKLNDDQKKTVFGLTFEKAILENQIPTQYEENKLNAIEQAKINLKKKQAKDIQAELDKIFLADDSLKKESPILAKKTIEEVDKHLTPEKPKEGQPKFAGSLKELYEKHAEDLGSLDINPTKKEKKPEVVETRAFEEIPFADWNQKRDSDKFKVLSEHLDTQNKAEVGELKLMKGGEGQVSNDTVHIKLPNNKWVILASSATDRKTKLRGHLHIENLPKDFDGHKVVIKPTRLTTGRIVLPVYNSETGKHVGYVREDNTGKANKKLFAKRALKIGADEATKVEEKEIEELQHLKTVKLTKNEIEATNRPVTQNQPSVEKVTPEAKETQPKAQEVVEPASKEEYIADRIEALKQDENASYDPSMDETYAKIFGNQYEKQNRSTEGDTTTSEESTAGDNKEISGEGKEVSPKKLRTKRKGTARNKQKITDPIRIKALEIESDKPYDLALQYFIKNGSIKFGEIFKMFKGNKTESNKRLSLQSNNAPTIGGLADELWTSYSDSGFGTERYTSMDFYSAVEEVLRNFHSRTDMAQDLVDRWEVKIDPREQMVSDELNLAEKQGVEERTGEIISEGEKLGNDEITDLANDQDKFDLWGNPIIDIIRRDDIDDVGDVFQKPKEQQPLAERAPQDVTKVVEAIQKAMPNMNISFDESLDAAGVLKADGKTILINPYHAGKDTPIHEAGHVLIDLMGGMNNTVIRNAIKQLSNTKLWSETKERYPELSEEELGYEVLAEAIGREGAGIFDKEVEKNIFMKYLEYIYNRLKQLLGIDKEIAKSLAKQIIAGIGVNKVGKGAGKEQFAKTYKTFAEKTQAEQVRALTLSFDQYSEKALKRNLIVEAQNIEKVNEALEDETLDERERTIWESVKQDLENRKKQDLREWYDYREDMKWAVTLYADITDLEEKAQSKEITNQEFTDGLVEIYNVLNGFQKAAREAVEANLMSKIAYGLFQQGKDVLKKNDRFIEEVANKADISVKDVWLKNLGHMTEKVPELQVFGKLFDEAAFDKVEEAKEKKHTFEKLGTAVIKEANKKLGISGKAESLYSSDIAQYFNYMDNGSGELLTLNEANEQNLSSAQIAFLKYNRELIAEHKGMIMDDAVYNMPLQVLKTDPTFYESYKQNGINQAFSNYLGTNYNLKQVRIPFKDPDTKITEVLSFGEIEAKLIKYGGNSKSLVNLENADKKGKAMALLLKYNRNARIQLKKGVNVDEKENPLLVKNNSQFSIDNNGVLSSKFDKPRDKSRGYSKDFYRAGIEFIDDMTHVKHFSKLVPLINSIEYLNKEGFEEHAKKPEVVKWINQWRDLHLFKNPKQTLPEIDATLRFLRKFTSSITMLFNVPAGLMNIGMGLYNNYRAETDAWKAKGHQRLFLKGGRQFGFDYALGAINPYAIDILRKYDVVSTDFDSNPKLSAGKIFDTLGHALTRYGEFQIQGTNFLGQMSENEYNSFEYKENKQGVRELVIKDGVNAKELKAKLIDYKNRVSDIQGKYGEKDRRNINNNELGAAVLQFRQWLPDAWKERFGERYIDRNGKIKQGTWRVFVGEGWNELKREIEDKGAVKAFWENKDFMSNLKGAMFTVFFMALAYQDDDDKKRSKAALDADNALSQLLFVFDPNQLKFILERPMASVGTLTKFIDAGIHLSQLDADKLKKDMLKLTPANKIAKIPEIFE